jgi:hypothetical protein
MTQSAPVIRDKRSLESKLRRGDALIFTHEDEQATLATKQTSIAMMSLIINMKASPTMSLKISEEKMLHFCSHDVHENS